MYSSRYLLYIPYPYSTDASEEQNRVGTRHQLITTRGGSRSLYVIGYWQSWGVLSPDVLYLHAYGYLPTGRLRRIIHG